MKYRIDNFEFSPDRGLFCSGESVPLEPRAYELLTQLIELRDRVVSKEDLVERIWKGRPVSDAAISTVVRTLRRTLGDDRTQQKYIRTYPKRGFEFVAKVEIVEDTPTAGLNTLDRAGVPETIRRRTPRRLSYWIGGLLVLPVVIVLSTLGT